MKNKIREDIISVLHHALVALDERDLTKLKNLSNKVIHNASVFQDKDSLGVAVIIYALSKSLSRESRMDENAYSRILNRTKKSINEMIKYLGKKDHEKFDEEMKSVLKRISSLDKKYSQYVEWAVTNAKMKKGRNIYEHGISLGRVSELLGISEWELMRYTAQTKFHDRDELKTLTAGDRLKKLKKVFEGDKNE